MEGRTETSSGPGLVGATSSTVRLFSASEQDTTATDATARLSRKSQLIFGVVLVLVIAVTLVAGTQVSKETFLPGFSAPGVITWFCTTWMVVCFPVYLAYRHLTAGRGPTASTGAIVRKSLLLFGETGLTLRSFTLKSLPFTILWFCANYFYTFALRFISPADATAMFTSNVAFICLLEWIILKEPFNIFRVSAVLVSVSGVVLIAASEGFTPVTGTAIGLILLSSSTSALYKVSFKKVVGTTLGAGEVSIFLTILGATSAVLVLCVVLVLWRADLEEFTLDDIPWSFLVANAAIALAYNFLINFGIAVTYPLFISLGVFLSIPLNTATDAIFRGSEFDGLKIGGTLLVMAGFLLVLTPSDWNSRFLDGVKSLCRVASTTEDGNVNMSVGTETDSTLYQSSEYKIANDVVTKL